MPASVLAFAINMDARDTLKHYNASSGTELSPLPLPVCPETNTLTHNNATATATAAANKTAAGKADEGGGTQPGHGSGSRGAAGPAGPAGPGPVVSYSNLTFGFYAVGVCGVLLLLSASVPGLRALVFAR